jgi:hypothetical protein
VNTTTRLEAATRRPTSLSPVAEGDIYAQALSGKLSFAALDALLHEATRLQRRSDARVSS